MRRKLVYDPSRDYYQILGIESDATPDEVRLAYRRGVRAVHPDLNPHRHAWATEQIQRINEAYDVLRDPDRRREYDRLRWPYIPGTAGQGTKRATGYRSPFDAPYYDPDRPWWEQVVTTAPPRASARRRAAAARRAQAARPHPAWARLSRWLRAHHLGVLERVLLTAVGLGRSPYAGLLIVLGTVLAINVALIVYAFITPQGEAMWDNLLSSGTAQIAPSPVPPSPTPDLVRLTCLDPNVQIHVPVKYDVVGESFSVYGTVQSPDLWHYRLDLAYLGKSLGMNPAATAWETVRWPPANQSVAEPPVTDDVLTGEPVSMIGRPSGYYALRLRVVLRCGQVLPPCDVIVSY